VFRVEGSRGAVWFAKYRLATGRQVKKRLGPAAPERGRPPAGYFTKRAAEDWLRDTLDQIRREALPGTIKSPPATTAGTGSQEARSAGGAMRVGEDESLVERGSFA
jgi:hypothetical protein